MLQGVGRELDGKHARGDGRPGRSTGGRVVRIGVFKGPVYRERQVEWAKDEAGQCQSERIHRARLSDQTSGRVQGADEGICVNVRVRGGKPVAWIWICVRVNMRTTEMREGTDDDWT